jgi:hypothetical protein
VDGGRDLGDAEHEHKIKEELNETGAAVFGHEENSSEAAGHDSAGHRTQPAPYFASCAFPSAPARRRFGRVAHISVRQTWRASADPRPIRQYAVAGTSQKNRGVRVRIKAPRGTVGARRRR